MDVSFVFPKRLQSQSMTEDDRVTENNEERGRKSENT